MVWKIVLIGAVVTLTGCFSREVVREQPIVQQQPVIERERVVQQPPVIERERTVIVRPQ
jgi:hypothetical protein